MTPKEIEAIKRRCEAATAGPWYPVATDDQACMNARYVGTKDRNWPKHDQEIGMDGSRAEETVAITLYQIPTLIDNERCDENTNFIAHAREDVPALVAEVRRLRGILNAVKSDIQNEFYNAALTRIRSVLGEE